jgi:hypothetical protein
MFRRQVLARVLRPRATGCALLALVCAPAWAGSAEADRIFYRGGTWLETSAAVQRLSLLGVLRGWEQVAETGGTAALSRRQREALRLHDCLTGSSRSTDELLDRITAFSFAHADRLYYSLSDFITEGLRDLCAYR